jgi:hypothetical protein
VAFGFIISCCLFAGGCFSIEQEIFLNADGSGKMVMFISLPDLPEKMGPAEGGAKKDPALALADFKKELTSALPPTVKLVEAKEVKQNGVQSLYAIFEFKQLRDVQRVLGNFGKSTLKENDMGSKPEWTITLQKIANKTVYQTITVNGKEQPKKPGEDQSTASADLGEELKPLLLSIVRMRFVLHAPSPITDSNADIVLNQTTAVWNCSLAAFAKVKKPIDMRASF